MDANPPAYWLWTLVAINVAVFAFFALSFYKPQTSRDPNPCYTVHTDLRDLSVSS